MASPIVFLMGPSASGKTALAVELVQRLPCEIISVDSAMIYRGMDIGTAKPTADILKIAPHRLINLFDPCEPYSAGDFRSDALREIAEITSKGRVPLLVGGTMMYFKILTSGLAPLPKANAPLRLKLQAQAEAEGWPALHAFLKTIDAVAAARIQPNDGQRIQRAVEVYLLSGKPISVWQVEETRPLEGYDIHPFALIPPDREVLYAAIEKRFDEMLQLGFIEEVKTLFDRGDLSPDLPAIRSVGYAEIWQYLSGHLTKAEMREQAITATRRLAKRQLTWLRSWPGLMSLQVGSSEAYECIVKMLI